MICPRCEVEMRKVHVNAVELDTCDNCEGVWFDKGELRQILDMEESEIEASPIAHALDSDMELEETPGLSEMKCPRCRGGLTRYNYQGYSGILLDGCDSQCGIWLDDGELRKLFTFMLDAVKPDPAREAGLAADLKQIKLDAREKHRKLMDSLILMDNRPGLMRIPGVLLQGIYGLLDRMGM